MAAPPDTGFDATYGRFKDYATPALKPKHIRRFDQEVWAPAGCAAPMAMLEIGCGTGQFLSYLAAKGVGDFTGIDHDPALRAHVPPALADRLRIADAMKYLAAGAEGGRFDRVFLFDVIEHFSPTDGVRLLRLIAGVLRPGGRVLVKVPNAGSPWGAQYQHGDLTHRAAYTPSSMRQLAITAGFTCVSCHPNAEGSPTRRRLDRAFHALLSRILMSPPEIWSANFYALLRPDGGEGGGGEVG